MEAAFWAPSVLFDTAGSLPEVHFLLATSSEALSCPFCLLEIGILVSELVETVSIVRLLAELSVSDSSPFF